MRTVLRMDVHLLGNLTAAHGRSDVDDVEDRLREAGHVIHRIRATTADESRVGARAAVAGGAERLVVVGGDGVVRIAVDAVAGSATQLGIVPQGTGNDFARALGLHGGDLDAAIDAALSETVPIDAMKTNHGWVASVATLGFAGDVTDRANRLRWPRGQQRYTVATLLQMPRLRGIAATIEIDGTVHDAATTMLAVGNTQYFGGGMKICPDARPSDGELQTVVIGDVPRRTFLRVFPRVFAGRHLSHRDVVAYRSRSVTIAGDPSVMVWADGDPLGPLPVTCTAVAGAIRVAGVRRV